MGTTTNFALRSDFIYFEGFGLGEMSFHHTLDLIFELDETTLATGRLVNGLPCDRIDMIIEDLDLEPKIDAMVREFLE
ncbi:hypothetical protein Tco_0400482 [Tanacetum coccineum]